MAQDQDLERDELVPLLSPGKRHSGDDDVVLGPPAKRFKPGEGHEGLTVEVLGSNPGTVVKGYDTSDHIHDIPIPASSTVGPSTVSPTFTHGPHCQGRVHREMDDGTTYIDISPLTPTSDIDFSAAPSDPIELAVWVAKQISSFHQPNGDDNGDAVEGCRPTAYAPELDVCRLDDDQGPEKAAERERQREDNRERKKRWRESNTERNKDNDLRCRINKRAKQIWGSRQPPERLAWIEGEFNKRRAKRETKERFRGLEDGSPTSPPMPDPSPSPFPAASADIGIQGPTTAASLLFDNSQLEVNDQGQSLHFDAANALKTALEQGMIDPRPFTDALRAMATNPDMARYPTKPPDRSPEEVQKARSFGFPPLPGRRIGT